VETRVALSADEAVGAANEIGFPVVLKLHSFTVTHKTDVDGVQLNLKDEDAVRAAFEKIKVGVTKHAGEESFNGVTVQPMAKLDGYELIIGSSLDAQFGPVLLFGSGGQLVEVYKDSALALPPLNATLARRLMEKTQIFKALKGVRGRPPVDMAKLESLLVRFSQLVVEQRWIKEIDINPLLASHEQLIALDARVLLHDASTQESDLPQLAVRPYPSQYVTSATLRDGTPVTIRPIRPEDEPLLVKFHETLSERSVRLRYFQPLHLDQRTKHERLIRVCFSDYDRELPLVAEYSNGEGEREIIGVGRLSENARGDNAQVSLLVSDQWQGRGLGTQLLKLLLQAARDEKLQEVRAEILPENQPMQQLCKRAGFTLEEKPDSVRATLEL
jgi:acetyltransferase